jgi:GH25 family lysozyme M1 (1,4-beta-N-acetylmuramidase)
MKKRLILIVLLLIIIITIGIKEYKQYQIKHAVKIVELNTKEIEVHKKVKLKDLIKKINGKLLNNPIIDTTTIGEQKIDFYYLTEKNIKVPYTIKIKVVDRIPPIIYQSSIYSTVAGTITKEELEKSIFCGDNYDPNPKCTLTGEIDLNTPGEYKATFIGEDSSNNISKHQLIIRVKEKSNQKNSSSTNMSSTDFNDIINKYKTDNTSIGIDISKWQGNIDFKKVKDAGVEFVIMRIGRQSSPNEDIEMDVKFKEYYKAVKELGLPVGIYIYNTAVSSEDARKVAKWVIKELNGDKLDFPIAYNWEDWSHFMDYKISLHTLSEAYKAFEKELRNNGYDAMLYGSKFYLENVWSDFENSKVWLAHYTTETDYQGKYLMWQMTSLAKINGITENTVDIDILNK